MKRSVWARRPWTGTTTATLGFGMARRLLRGDAGTGHSPINSLQKILDPGRHPSGQGAGDRPHQWTRRRDVGDGAVEGAGAIAALPQEAIRPARTGQSGAASQQPRALPEDGGRRRGAAGLRAVRLRRPIADAQSAGRADPGPAPGRRRPRHRDARRTRSGPLPSRPRPDGRLHADNKRFHGEPRRANRRRFARRERIEPSPDWRPASAPRG